MKAVLCLPFVLAKNSNFNLRDKWVRLNEMTAAFCPKPICTQLKGDDSMDPMHNEHMDKKSNIKMRLVRKTPPFFLR